VTCKAEVLGLGQELKLGWKNKVLELPKQILGTKRIRGNQSIEESIQEVA
jgi:hypothetical protein